MLDTSQYVRGHIWAQRQLQLMDMKSEDKTSDPVLLIIAALLGDEATIRSYLEKFPNEVVKSLSDSLYDNL